MYEDDYESAFNWLIGLVLGLMLLAFIFGGMMLASDNKKYESCTTHNGTIVDGQCLDKSAIIKT
jgi:hypothetical protein